MPDIDFKALGDEMLSDLKATGEAFWDKLQEDQKPIIEQAGKDLAKYSLLLVTDPANADLYKEMILAIKSTLSSETTLTAIRASERLKESLQRALKKLMAVGLALL